MRRPRLIALEVALLSMSPLAAAASAGTLDVPAQYPTIQAAIVAAQPGDTVLVAPGTYVETIDFLGKAITVESSGGAAVTTIDGNSGGSVVTFQTGETQGSVLKGFTITGGNGSDYKGNQVGGGIKIVKSGPSVVDCQIAGNAARDMGGGVYVRRDTTALVSPLFTGCTIAGNATTGPTSAFVVPGGGGIAGHEGDGTLTACTITGNSTHGDGGGVATIHFGGFKLTNCVIEDNQAAGRGGGIGEGSTFIPTSSIDLTECIVRDNSAGDRGGGVFALLQGDTPLVASTLRLSRTVVSGNTAATDGGGIAVGTDSIALASIESSLIVDNIAQTSGGGVSAGGDVNLWNCTIADNEAASAGGVSASLFLSTGLGPRQCIIWGNTGGQIAGTLPNPRYCDIEGGYAGTGNIDIDPFFVDSANGDYHIAPTSACEDAGDPTWLPGGKDIDGDPRVLFGRIDIGADEATLPKGPWTFLGHALAGSGGTPSLAGTGTLTPGSPTTLSLSVAATGSASWLIAGAGTPLLPFKGGVMVPTIDMLIGPIGIGAAGSSVLSGRWPNGVPPGFVVTLQDWIADANGPSGFTASNGLAAQSQ